MKYFAIAAAAILALAATATGSEARSKARAFTNAGEFAQELKSSGNFEILSSALALQNSDNGEIKKFAQKMIDDHKAADRKLTDTLKQANLPEPEYTMTEENTALVQDLSPCMERGSIADTCRIKSRLTGTQSSSSRDIRRAATTTP